MEIYYHIDEIQRCEGSIVTVGTFDGVHLGHQAIIKELKAISGGPSTLITFEPHPQRVLNPRQSIKILTPLEEKLQILRELGLDKVLVLRFDEKIAQMPPRGFIEEIIINRIGVKEMVIGYDHAFGRGRSGHKDTLKQLGDDFGFKLKVLQPITIDGRIVKSTLIRRLLEEGQVREANRLLGRLYRLSGWVIRGEGRGKTLHFPTANIRIEREEKLIPGDGVYAVLVHLKGKPYKGILNIGFKPTFGSQERAIEVHILDFDSNIYNQRIEIEFVDKIREERRFKSPSELTIQMKRDRKRGLEVLEQ